MDKYNMLWLERYKCIICFQYNCYLEEWHDKSKLKNIACHQIILYDITIPWRVKDVQKEEKFSEEVYCHIYVPLVFVALQSKG